jgi:hypothetical protein
MQKITVAKILYWLSNSEYVGTTHEFNSMGGGPNEFVMKTKTGKTIVIVDAIGYVSVKVSNGGMAESVSISDQVTVFYQNKTRRFKDLKQWIETDMNKIIEERLRERQQSES